MIALILTFALIFAPFQTPTPPAPTPLQYGQSVTGELSTLLPEALYTFTGNSGDVIVITMERTTGIIDPLILLTDSAQKNVLAVDNDSGGSPNARLQFVLPETTDYIIRASAVQTADLDGGFRLTINALNATQSPKQSVLSLLQPTQEIRLDIQTPQHFHPFYLQKGETVTLRWTFTESLLGAGFSIYSADFALLASTGRDVAAKTLSMDAPYDGWYWLMVGFAGGSGAYILNANFPAHTAPPPDATRLIPGQTQRGNLNNVNGARYAFTAPSGTIIDLTLNGDGIAILYDANFRELASGTALRNVNLSASGAYYLLVFGLTGEFSFMLQGTLDASISLTPQGTPFSNQLAYGDSTKGQISEGTPRLFYTFRGNADDVVIIQLLRTADNTLDPLLYLYQYVDGKPQLIATVNDRAPGDVDAMLNDFKLPANGTYLIVASGANNTVGSFILSLNRRAN